MINFIIIVFYCSVTARECGPMCPVCSGSTDGSLLASNSFLFTSMNIPGSEEENGLINLHYSVFPRFDVGAGYTFKSEKALWSERLETFRENEESWIPINWLSVSVLMIESEEPALSAGVRWSYNNNGVNTQNRELKIIVRCSQISTSDTYNSGIDDSSFY